MAPKRSTRISNNVKAATKADDAAHEKTPTTKRGRGRPKKVTETQPAARGRPKKAVAQSNVRDSGVTKPNTGLKRGPKPKGRPASSKPTHSAGSNALGRPAKSKSTQHAVLERIDRDSLVAKLDRARSGTHTRVTGLKKDGSVKGTVLMHQYIAANRIAFPELENNKKEQRKKIIEMWKDAPENPKNATGGASATAGIALGVGPSTNRGASGSDE